MRLGLTDFMMAAEEALSEAQTDKVRCLTVLNRSDQMRDAKAGQRLGRTGR